jgi:hypothetical protein
MFGYLMMMNEHGKYGRDSCSRCLIDVKNRLGRFGESVHTGFGKGVKDDMVSIG